MNKFAAFFKSGLVIQFDARDQIGFHERTGKAIHQPFFQMYVAPEVRLLLHQQQGRGKTGRSSAGDRQQIVRRTHGGHDQVRPQVELLPAPVPYGTRPGDVMPPLAQQAADPGRTLALGPDEQNSCYSVRI